VFLSPVFLRRGIEGLIHNLAWVGCGDTDSREDRISSTSSSEAGPSPSSPLSILERACLDADRLLSSRLLSFSLLLNFKNSCQTLGDFRGEATDGDLVVGVLVGVVERDR
jgi:hypothetical protein